MDKPEILDTIKRMAEENGGQPPGWNSFRSATSLKSHEWKPRFWLRWSDALEEAGYQANRFGKDKLDPDFLAQKLAELARELGHFPLLDEIARKRLADPDFPSKSGFQRWGDKSHRVTKVLEYCKSHEGLEDVASMCSDVVNSKIKTREETSTSNNSIGYVYLIKHGSRREYKIGRTNNPIRRIGEFKTEFPEQLTPIHTITTDDPAGIEGYWQKRFKDKRKQGEWFALNQDDVRAFQKWKRIV